MEISAKIVNGFGKYYARVSSLIKLLAELKKETPVEVFSGEFREENFFKEHFRPTVSG